VPGSATARVPLLDGPHVLTTAAAVIGLGVAVIVLAAPQPGAARDDRSAEHMSVSLVVL
jgi:hypothetical protein